MKRHLAPAMLCALPIAAVIAGCSGGTNGLSGLGSSVTTPSSINTKLTPVPTTEAPTATPTPVIDPANQSFALAISGVPTDYKGVSPTGLPLTKAELKTEKEVSTLAVTYGTAASTFEVSLIKKGAFAVGDVFTFGAKKANRATTKFTSVTGEEPPVVFNFVAAEKVATAKIIAINVTNYTIELTDLTYSNSAKAPVTFGLTGTVVVSLYEGKVG